MGAKALLELPVIALSYLATARGENKTFFIITTSNAHHPLSKQWKCAEWPATGQRKRKLPNPLRQPYGNGGSTEVGTRGGAAPDERVSSFPS